MFYVFSIDFLFYFINMFNEIYLLSLQIVKKLF